MVVSVNHEAWIEPSERGLLVRWGHYPRVDGRLDPHVVRSVVVIGEERYIPVLFVHEKEALRLVWRGGAAHAAVLWYTRGPFTKIRGEWVYGDGCSVERVYGERGESMVIEGFAVYAKSPRHLNLSLLPSAAKPVLDAEGGGLRVGGRGVRVWCNGVEAEDGVCREAPIFVLVKVDESLSAGCVDKVRWVSTLFIESL